MHTDFHRFAVAEYTARRGDMRHGLSAVTR